MLDRRKLSATILPIVAFGLLIGPGIGVSDDMSRKVSSAAVGTLDTASHGRAVIRGARPADRVTADSMATTTDHTTDLAQHPRRPSGSRALPTTADSIVIVEQDTGDAGRPDIRGARSSTQG